MNGNVIHYDNSQNNEVTFGTFCKRYLIEDPVSFYNYIQDDFYVVFGKRKYLQFKGSELRNVEYNPELTFFENDLSQLDLARKAEKRNDGLSLKSVKCWKKGGME